jgi:hypothetical protein
MAPAWRDLGGQAQLWTEYLPDDASREYRALPRLSVLAANLWSGRAPGLPALLPALADRLDRLDAHHVRYRPLAGPRPRQRAGTGRRVPRGVVDLADLAGFLDRTPDHPEPQ